jgi:hypothetical protein
LETENAKTVESRRIGESLLADAGDLVLGVEPHPQPVADVVVHDSVGAADAAETEVVTPA